MKPIKSVASLLRLLLLLLTLPAVVQAQILVEDGFAGGAGALPDAAKFEWGGQLAQNGAGQLNLSTDTANTSWIKSQTNAAPLAGEALVLKMRLSAYAEPAVYGDQQPRGLRVGSDASNVLEFYSIYGTTIGLRARKDGVETLISYPFSAGVYSMHDYEISVTTTAAVFKVDGVVAGTLTNNIPTGALNFYVSTFDGYFGNVPVTIDAMELSLTNDAVAQPLDFIWATNSGAITITDYIGTNGVVIIPSTINGFPVTEIGQNAFNEYFQPQILTSVVIPDSVTNVGDGAFANCSSLTNVTIGTGLVGIGYHAFDSCPALKAFVVDALNPVFSSLDGVLFTHDQSTLIQYPAGLAGNYTIPGTVTNIGTQAFANCNGLTGLSIPGSVTGIEHQAFYACYNLPSVVIPDSVGGTLYQTFVWCSGLTNAVIGNGVTSLDGTFSQCGNLAAISIGQSVTNISGAFVNCSSLKNVPLPNSVTSLGDMAFAGCTSLTNLVIPDSVTSLGDSVFSACHSLTELLIPDSVTNLGDYAFHYCTGLTNVTIGSGITSIGSFAFKECGSLTGIAIPDNVTSIGEGAFNHCTNVTSIMIGKSVSYLDSGMFHGCGRLTAITVDASNSSWSSLDGVLFDKNRTRLIEYPEGRVGYYTIPNTVTNIGNYSFQDCTGLTGITIPGSVTVVGSQAFYSCTGLTSITIPNSVSNVLDNAFASCPNLRGVYFQGNAPAFSSSAFSGDNNATVYYLPGTTGWDTVLISRPIVLWNPQVQTSDASFGIQTNQFGFNIVGSSNLVIVVEVCTNLTTPIWTPVGTNTLNTFIGTNGTSYFSDPQWTNFPSRFYRLRSP